MNSRFKLGDYVVLNKSLSDAEWYTNKPMKIIGFALNSIGLLKVEHNFYQFIGYDGEEDINDNQIAEEHVHYYPMRRNKLKRLLEDETSQ